MLGPGQSCLCVLAACTIWGLSPLYYAQLSHVPAPEVLGHRVVWSCVLFGLVLALRGWLGQLSDAVADKPARRRLMAATAMISVNWFLFIVLVQWGRATETSLGYFICPLVAVVLGRVVLGERLGVMQIAAVALAAVGVGVMTFGAGVPPWAAMTLAVTFALYGLIKKHMPLRPMVSVTAEAGVLAPFAIAGLIWWGDRGQFGTNWHDTVMLMGAGPLTAVPLMMFSAGARGVSLASLGMIQYLNPSLQFVCAVVILSEPFTPLHSLAFGLIWGALAVYSVAVYRQDRPRRRAAMAASASGTTVR
ncbi:MAG: EamA family transporter RarD [Primorskyibacter sp.]